MTRGFEQHSPLRRSILGTATIALPLLVLVGVIALTMGPVGQQLLVNTLISLIAVIGFGIYSGNSGIMTFGHVAFIGIAAYVSGLLTVPPAIKAVIVPSLPSWMLDLELSLLPAMLAAVVVVVLFAVFFGLPFARLSAAATPIATFTMLLITFILLVGAKAITRGSETFYGVPPKTTVFIAVVAALIALFIARLFRESVIGVQLQASREDELAARSMGINVPYLRLLAWLLSASIVAVSGVLQAHELTAFSPKQFYIPLQFMLVAMLVVGGQATVTGAAVGTVIVATLLEIARRIEIGLYGVSIGPIEIENLFGLQEITLGALILAVMFWRRDGLFDFDELDDIIRKTLRGRSSMPGEATIEARDGKENQG